MSDPWWRRRVLPPGPIGLFRQPFIAIAGFRRLHQYKAGGLTRKEATKERARKIEATKGDASGRRQRALAVPGRHGLGTRAVAAQPVEISQSAATAVNSALESGPSRPSVAHAPIP